MPNTPGYVSNAELAARLSALVDRWNTRENQMIALLTQDTGTVVVTDGLGQNHTLPSFPQLQKDVSALTDELTGAVAQVRDMNGQALGFANAAAAEADRAEAAADEAAAQVPLAQAQVTAAAAQVALAQAQVDAAKAEADRAASKATHAANSATTAADHVTAASGHATAASNSATQAGTYASNASASASAASTHASNAAQAKTDAQAARDLAQQWASAPQGTQVAPGEYSAKHWALQAQAAVTGTLLYMGPWDASTGVYPPSPNRGHFYKVTVAGTVGGVSYLPGDQIIYNGSDWDKVDNTDAVSSVAGKSGAVTLVAADIGGLGALATKSSVDWNSSDVINKPATYTPSAHTHSGADIVSGTVADARLPTTMGGKTFTGTVSVTNGNVVVQAPAAGNANLWMRDDVGTNRGVIYWNRSGDDCVIRRFAADGSTVAGEIRFNATNLTWNGNAVYHAGNFNPASKADLSGATFTGTLKVGRASGAADAVPDFQASNGDHWLSNFARLSAGSYNPLVQAGDKALIFTDGTVGTGALVLAPWANSAAGLRVTGNGDTTIAGSLAISGTARRILADFSSSPAIRTFLQTSVTNGAANVGVIPHGTGNVGIVAVFNSSDPANAGTLQLRMEPFAAILNSGKTGSGVLRDMSFQFDSVERARLYTDGRFQVSGRIIGDGAQIGRWGTGSAYVGLFAGDMASGAEYMVMASEVGSTDAHTYISARNTGAVRIRPSANTISAETSFETTGVYFRTSVYQLNATGSAFVRQPRCFVQPDDPGAAAQDGDLWVW